MAEAFPNSEFFGFDYHMPSIDRARQAASEAGVDERIMFEAAAAKDFPGNDYDLVCVFDCLHDMGDPGRGVGARAARRCVRRHVDDRRAVREATASRRTSTRSAGSSTAPRR